MQEAAKRALAYLDWEGGHIGEYGPALHHDDVRLLAYSALSQQPPASEVEAIKAALEPVMHWYQSDEHPERPLADIVTDVVADLQKDRSFVLNPPKHKYWYPGDPECPAELKAGNGELHTLRCKVCGKDNPRDDICRAGTPTQPDTTLRAENEALVEALEGLLPDLTHSELVEPEMVQNARNLVAAHRERQ